MARIAGVVTLAAGIGAVAGVAALPATVTAELLEPELFEQEVEQALKLDGDLDRGRLLFRTCVVCHSPEAWGTVDGYYPQIAGQHASVLIKQLGDIRARNRDNPTMRPFSVRPFLQSPQDLADVAAYIARLPMTPYNGVGPGSDLKYGERLYADECADCHGGAGEGDPQEQVPRIQGQHFNYLLRQFEWIRSGKRRNADSQMVKQIRRFTPRDEWAVLDYVSRQTLAEALRAPDGWRNRDFPDYVRLPAMSPRPAQTGTAETR